jgi:hypothetical protein
MGIMGVYPFTQSASTSDTTLLNDMIFDNYHQFRSDARILTGNIRHPIIDQLEQKHRRCNPSH